MRRCLSVVLAFLLPFAAWARAHSSSTSYVTIIASGHDARLQWSIALRDLDTAIVLDANDDGDITWGELRARQSEVDAYALSRLHLSTGGADCIAGPVEHLADLLGDGGYAVLRTALRCPVAIAGLDVRYGALFEIDPNHRALLNVTVEGVPHTGIASPSEPIAHFDASGGQFTLVRQFFQGGIEHLLAGADHVLFIVMLLAPLLLRPRPAAEGPLPRLAEIVTLLTAFTVAHGLTLTLAVLGLAHVSPAAAELGVASTILVTAARLAEVVFVTHSTLDPARAFRLDLRARGARFGRNPDEIKVLPGVVPIIGETTEEAEELRGLLESLSHSEAGLSTLSYHLGVDLSRLPQDQVLPETMDVPGVEGHYREVAELTRRTGMSVATLGQQYGAGRTARGFAGTARTVADRMQEWWEAGACDGFMLQIPYFPGGLERVVRPLVPELQRRGLFRTEYTGSTLRDHLGLTRPPA